MKCNAVPIALLLLTVINLCLGRAIPGRGRSDPAPDYSMVFTQKRTLPKLKPTDVEPSPGGIPKGGQAGNGQSEGSGQRGDGQQAPSTQHGGDEATMPEPPPPAALKPAPDLAAAPPPSQVEQKFLAAKPAGLNKDDLTLWKAMDDTPMGIGEID
ncbi:hypothetical protein BKA65DRAFT_558482 [Rhexocercosporidium sp. MPI-PUGE-AT-0058]|nr:hypothetical protein BKA65DRAFT_558482 [Rhexocercosporidium sp. MPI-PUGE-AT-0058]